MNKNIVMLLALILGLFVIIFMYAWPQWKKYNPSPPPAGQMPGGAGGTMPGMPGGPPPMPPPGE